ncbi:DUF6126 family protein [Streptomyces spirodelae]|uniref:Small hydrophobic protein n=1 Tax=Streptomyces spirodelae TaxID=2812904 RepID=A0ABS3X0D2_9ACTN|nr:hypothetical protein [Streptomyces spirodelae]
MTTEQPAQPQPPASGTSVSGQPSPGSVPPPAQRRRRDEPGEERGDGRFPRGLALRLFVYVVAGHLMAGFLFLLFELGGSR